MEREDGEMSDDAMFVDEEKKLSTEADIEAVIYKAEKNGLVVEKLEKADAGKLEERAKRFGLNLTGSKVITQNQIDKLYHNTGIDRELERHFRLDTLHLYGVDGLTTREIFEYLEDYKPVSLEWVDVNTCNVVCQDHISAALALLVHSREIYDTNIKEMVSTASKHYWREGMPHHKKDFLFMRFATNSDKNVKSGAKVPQIRHPREIDDPMEPISKNPWGHLSKSWGVYDHQEVWNRPFSDHEYEIKHEKNIKIRNKQLASRLGKRNYQSEDSDSSISSSEWRKQAKVPRMRMRADEEEDKQKKKQQPLETNVKIKQEDDELAPLSIEVVNTDIPFAPKQSKKLSDRFKTHMSIRTYSRTKIKEGIHSRLGSKVQQSNDYSSEDSSSKSEHNVMSRVQRVSKHQNNSTSDVWSRLETQEKSGRNDLRNKLKSRVTKKSSDLRDRLGKTKQGISLRIEVDNDYHDSD